MANENNNKNQLAADKNRKRKLQKAEPPSAQEIGKKAGRVALMVAPGGVFLRPIASLINRARKPSGQSQSVDEAGTQAVKTVGKTAIAALFSLLWFTIGTVGIGIFMLILILGPVIGIVLWWYS